MSEVMDIKNLATARRPPQLLST